MVQQLTASNYLHFKTQINQQNFLIQYSLESFHYMHLNPVTSEIFSTCKSYECRIATLYLGMLNEHQLIDIRL